MNHIESPSPLVPHISNHYLHPPCINPEVCFRNPSGATAPLLVTPHRCHGSPPFHSFHSTALPAERLPHGRAELGDPLAAAHLVLGQDLRRRAWRVPRAVPRNPLRWVASALRGAADGGQTSGGLFCRVLDEGLLEPLPHSD